MLRQIFQPIRFDWKIATITIVSTLALMVDSYHRFAPRKEVDRTFLYLIVPIIFIVFVFREHPR